VPCGFFSFFSALRFDLSPALRHDFCRHQLEGDEDQCRDNNHVVYVTEDRDKIGYEVEGQQSIPDG